MSLSQFPIARLLFFGLFASVCGFAQDGANEFNLDEQTEPPLQNEALARVQREVAAQQEKRSRQPSVALEDAGVPLRVSGGMDDGPRLYNNGVTYQEDWTIRAGVTKLRVPAYDGWNAVREDTRFPEWQVGLSQDGNTLARTLMNEGYVRATRSRFVNYFSLIWVPQEFAFREVSLEEFARFKEGVQEDTVKARRATLKRDDFKDFEDYLNFKFGHDDIVEDFVDGYMIRAYEGDDMVIYFATSNFRYTGGKVDVIDPMIVTVTYALVRGKLIRIEHKRPYEADEDVANLINFSQAFVQDMRLVNGLDPEKARR